MSSEEIKNKDQKERKVVEKPVNKKAMKKNRKLVAKKKAQKKIEKLNKLNEIKKDDLKKDNSSFKDKVKEIFTLDYLLSTLKDNYKVFLTFFVMNVICILYWEIIMFLENGGIKLTSLFFLFFVPAQSMFLTFLCGWGKDIIARITAPIVLLLISIFYIVQMVYYRNFGSFFSVSMAGMGNDAVGNFWWALEDTLKGAIGRIILILLPVIVVTALVIINKVKFIKFNKYSCTMHILGLIATVLLWLIAILGIRLFGNGRQSAYFLLTNTSVNTDTSAKKLGVLTTSIVEAGAYYFKIGTTTESNNSFTQNTEAYSLSEPVVEDEEVTFERKPWINEAIDFNEIANQLEDSELKSMAEYFATREPSYTNEYTGLFEGYNLIYICAESFWTYACNEKVTPTLYKMANNGIVLNNYYNSLKNTTTNGEFAFTTSFWPDVSRVADNGKDVGSFPRSASIFMPQGLGDLFSENGVPTYAYHNYFGKYYRRILSWPNLGYENIRFNGDNMSFTFNWPASDLEMMQQTVDDFINQDRFHTYYMTFSGHGPYTAKNRMYLQNINETYEKIGSTDKYNSMAAGYLACNLEFDKAMEYLLNRLEEAGKLDNTVIVIAGDHYPYYLDADSRTSLVGRTMDEDFEIYKSTCIIYNAGLKEPIVNDEYCCNVDIVPTILNLFNIPFDSRLYMGKDVFSNSVHRAALYNKNFITDKVKYNYETGETVWSAKGNELSEDEKSKYLEAMISLVENEYLASCKLVSDNFFFHVYQKAGLLNQEQIDAEIKREAAVKADIDNYAAEDEAIAAEREAERLAEEEAQHQLEVEAQLEQWRAEVEAMQNGEVVPNADNQNPVVNDPNAVAAPDANVQVPAVPDADTQVVPQNNDAAAVAPVVPDNANNVAIP